MEPNIDKLISFWISEADEALKVADHLVEKEDFSYALFFGHLALEKNVKSIVREEDAGTCPSNPQS